MHKDNTPVTVLSSGHELGSEAVNIRKHLGTKSTDAKRAEKIRKHPGAKSTNAKRAREVLGDAGEEVMPIPLCIND